MEYKELSAYEKLKQIQKLRLCRSERHNAAIYLNALRRNDIAIIEDYESFGDTAHKLLMNKQEHEKNLFFGFTKKEFNEHGWLVRPEFLEKEEIQFPHRTGWAICNYITLGRSINGMWTYGMSYSYSTGGAGFGLSVWGDVFSNRKDCLIAALKKLMAELGKRSCNTDKYALVVLKQAKNLYDEITGRKVIQLTLAF